MVNRRTLLTAVSAGSLAAFGIAYLATTPDPDTRIILALATALAALGGVEFRGRRADR